MQLQMGVRLQVSCPKCAGYPGSWGWALKSERGRQKNRCRRWQIRKNSSDMVGSEHSARATSQETWVAHNLYYDLWEIYIWSFRWPKYIIIYIWSSSTVPGSCLPNLLELLTLQATGASFAIMFGFLSSVRKLLQEHKGEMGILSLIQVPFYPSGVCVHDVTLGKPLSTGEGLAARGTNLE